MNGCCEVKKTIAEELLDRFTEVSNRATSLAHIVNDKLSPIMSHGDDEDKCSDPPIRPYPQLFSEYRERLFEIEKALDAIDDCLRLVEV